MKRKATKGRAAKAPQTKSLKLMIYLPPDLNHRLRLHAVETHRRISDVVAEALQNYLPRIIKVIYTKQ